MIVNDRESANKYFQVVNDLINNYINKHKIKPTNLKRYLKKGSDRYNRFLERNNLHEIKNIDVVIRNVIEDRCHMEKDNVMTFESFINDKPFLPKDLNQCVYINIQKATEQMERVIADYFDTNLGSVDIIDTNKHLFTVDGWEEPKNIIIYTIDEMDIIKDNILDFYYFLTTAERLEITQNLNIDLVDVVIQDVFKEKLGNAISESNLIDIIKNILNCNFVDKSRNHYLFETIS